MRGNAGITTATCLGATRRSCHAAKGVTALGAVARLHYKSLNYSA